MCGHTSSQPIEHVVETDWTQYQVTAATRPRGQWSLIYCQWSRHKTARIFRSNSSRSFENLCTSSPSGRMSILQSQRGHGNMFQHLFLQSKILQQIQIVCFAYLPFTFCLLNDYLHFYSLPNIITLRPSTRSNGKSEHLYNISCLRYSVRWLQKIHMFTYCRGRPHLSGFLLNPIVECHGWSHWILLDFWLHQAQSLKHRTLFTIQASIIYLSAGKRMVLLLLLMMMRAQARRYDWQVRERVVIKKSQH